MKSTARILVFGVVLLVLGSAGLHAVEQPWYISYETAIKMIEKDRFPEAERLLEAVIAVRAAPEADVPTYGMWVIDYTPYFYLGRALMGQDRQDEAIRAFKLAVLWGAVKADPEKMAIIEGAQDAAPVTAKRR